MRLFLIQDSDNPAYVVAEDWHDAIERWCAWYTDKYGDDELEMEPDGVQLLATDDEDGLGHSPDTLVLPKSEAERMFADFQVTVAAALNCAMTSVCDIASSTGMDTVKEIAEKLGIELQDDVPF